jgi:hypothetical protein
LNTKTNQSPWLYIVNSSVTMVVTQSAFSCDAFNISKQCKYMEEFYLRSSNLLKCHMVFTGSYQQFRGAYYLHVKV